MLLSLAAIKSFFNSKWALPLATVVIASLLLLTTYCAGRSDGKREEVSNQLERKIEGQKKVGAANENASASRLNDITKLQRQQQEIEDAVRDAKGPDDVRAQRGCVILRQQGRDTSSIPACSGFAAGR